MAYDEHLASRIRKALGATPGITEKRMFGGIAFLRHGLMFVGVIGHTLMARVGKALHDDSLAREHVRVMDFTGKPMAGYVFVDEPGAASDDALRFWLGRCLDFVATLPPKATAQEVAKPRRKPAGPARTASGTRGIDDTTSESARAWAPAYENHSFQAVPGGTRVVIDQDVTPAFEAYMVEAWPKALARLKALWEQPDAG